MGRGDSQQLGVPSGARTTEKGQKRGLCTPFWHAFPQRHGPAGGCTKSARSAGLRLVATHKKRKLACGFAGCTDLTSNRPPCPQSPHVFLSSSSQGLCQTHFTRPDLQRQAQGLGNLLASLGVFHIKTLSSGLPITLLEQLGYHNPPQTREAGARFQGAAHSSVM